MKTPAAFALLLCATLLPAPMRAQSPQRPAITGVAFVRFYAANLEASAKFYGGDMGFVRTPVNGRDIYSVNASQWIELAPLPAGATSRLAAIGFTTRNVKGLEAYLRAHGQTILPQPEPGRFGVKDPEGNLVIFVQRGTHPGANTPAPHATAHRIIHAGLVVRDVDAENGFYRTLLGFTPYWQGGGAPNRPHFASVQVPNGTDWVEYMYNLPPSPDAKTMGVMNHVSLGVENMDSVLAGLDANHCTTSDCKTARLGGDGKVQLNVYDPDLTRTEYMEFKPIVPPNGNPFTGRHPSAKDPE